MNVVIESVDFLSFLEPILGRKEGMVGLKREGRREGGRERHEDKNCGEVEEGYEGVDMIVKIGGRKGGREGGREEGRKGGMEGRR